MASFPLGRWDWELAALGGWVMVWPQASSQSEGQAAPRCPEFLQEALGAPHAVLGQSSGTSVPPPSCISLSGGEADALGTLIKRPHESLGDSVLCLH